MPANDVLYRGLSVLMIVMFFLAVFWKTRGRRGAVIGRERFGLNAENAVPNQHFCDVAAQDEAVEALQEMADMLKNPEKYAGYGARLPHGVLLYGPPGTG